MNYKSLINKIENIEDRTLIEECVDVIKCGQYRAAYILIWIACVESIVRRFNELKQFDSDAGKYYGKIIKIEEGRQATDKNIILYAKSYGFIDEIEYSKLLKTYELRCIFVHPYNQSPAIEEVDAAFLNIVEIILSKPLLLKEGYISREIDKLLKKKEYLGDYQDAINNYAEEFYQKIDKNLFEFFIKKYWDALEKLIYNPEDKIITNRGIIITKFLLSKYGDKILKTQTFHGIVLENDFMPLYVLTEPSIYNKLSSRIKDTLIANVINSKQNKLYKIKLIEPLFLKNILSSENVNKLKDSLANISFEDAEKFNLSLTLVYDLVIEKLKSYDWYSQSPAVKFIRKKSIHELELLKEKQQEILGRNILQVADGTENEANNYLFEIKNNPNIYPLDYIKGIIFEVFINENNTIRYKNKKNIEIVEIIEKLNDDSCKKIIEELLIILKNGTYRYSVDDYKVFIDSQTLKNCNKCSPILTLLQNKFENE